ncbi:hypothetical protein SUDANB1_07217 [Streptomyces sp. enrichment culture]|uniref:hypothetical protein n=1 Tax=Streptomyces sp. enrichment culture TaxID=1795815 RepID=UPI003F55721A
MTLDIRPTDDPEHFDLYEEDQKIGEIVTDLDIEDGVLMSPPLWCAEIWSQMGTGKTFTADSESLDEVKQYARELYDEMAAERRELSKGSRIWTTGSVPMGGKPGWRRR